jgi:glutathione S-transferase
MRWRLVYYDGRGQVEIVRLVFAMAGELPGRDYENVRLPLHYVGPNPKDYDCPRFNEVQAEGRLVCNMQRLPVLEEVGGSLSLGQSLSIIRYVGQQFGLMGRTYEDSAQINAIVEHVRDIRHAFATFKGSNDWFGDALVDTDDAAAAAAAASDNSKRLGRLSSSATMRENRNLGFWLRRLNKCVGDDGFSYGGAPTVADASIFFCFGESCPELRGGPYESGAEPFGNLQATRCALDMHGSRVASIVERFRAMAGVHEYLSTREPMVF